MATLQTLGRTDIKVSPIGLGTWQFSEGSGFSRYFWKKISEIDTVSIVKNSLENGINWFDTAELYGGGRSERALKNALIQNGKKNTDVVIATKWSPILRRAKSIKNTVNTRMNNLSPFEIDLYQIHMPYSFSSIKSQMKTMIHLIEEKKIKAVGVSNFSDKQMRKAFEVLEENNIKLASNQVRYSLVNRSIEKELIDSARELGITIIAYSPLAQGLLTGIYHENPEKLKSMPFLRKRRVKKNLKKTKFLNEALINIANNHNKTISQIALNWVINFQGDTVVAIPGASKPIQAKENAEVMQFSLSKEELDQLAELTTNFV